MGKYVAGDGCSRGQIIISLCLPSCVFNILYDKRFKKYARSFKKTEALLQPWKQNLQVPFKSIPLPPSNHPHACKMAAGVPAVVPEF